MGKPMLNCLKVSIIQLRELQPLLLPFARLGFSVFYCRKKKKKKRKKKKSLERFQQYIF